MQKLNNCPNCGGTLQDDGRCRFCGSKIYDLTDISLDEPKYVRIKFQNNIITGRVRFDDFTITTGVDIIPHGELSFRFLYDQNGELIRTETSEDHPE